MRLPKQLPCAERKRNRCAAIPAGANLRAAQLWSDLFPRQLIMDNFGGPLTTLPVAY
jgi:hypothetical protein